MYIVEEGMLESREFIILLNKNLSSYPIVFDNKKCAYYNIPAAFDIEVSSFYERNGGSEDKRAIMYIWQFGINNLVTYGREWWELKKLLHFVSKVLRLDSNRRLLVYVHNLPYEFQFIRKLFDWEKVFVLSERKPVYARTGGIEFRCSLKLAGGKSLENVGKDLKKYRVEKAVGNLDYKILRTPNTPLSTQELLYCENDIRVLLSYIQEKIEQDGDITKIPLTNTGYVRKYCRKYCFKRWKKYHNFMKELVISPDEYQQLKRAFQGGFTHANARYVRKVLENVGSHDFASSYPAVMVLEKFPISRSTIIDHPISDDELKHLLYAYCCLMDIIIYGVMPKLYQEYPISKYKCWKCENAIINNGRVVMADCIGTTITEQDFFVYREFYTWEYIEIKNFRYYQKGYLPTNFVQSVLDLYERKTSLKGNKDEEINYVISKNMINAAYGMMVTDPVRDDIQYHDDAFHKIHPDLDDSIKRYNDNIRRFLFYPWGVWVTAYARANLFSAIIEMGSDYVYSDTDSVKTLNTESHEPYFKRYNEEVIKKIERSSSFHRIDISKYCPEHNGSIKPIGVWDNEGIYSHFKTLGAKRYLTERVQSTGLEYEITLAGSNKKKTTQYLVESGNPFKNFDDGLTIPAEASGRLILTYIDDETEGDVIGIDGTPYHYHELSSIHMEESEYNLSISEEFNRYLEGLIDFGE